MAQADPDLFASLPDAVYRLDPGGRFTYLNGAAEALLERRAADLLGRDVRDVFPETGGSALEEGYQQVLADGRPRDFAYFFEPQQRWYEVRAFRSPGGLAVFFRDVDAHHRDDRRRDETMEELAAVLDSLPAATVLVDDDGRILSANRAWVADGEILRGFGVQPGRVGDDYLTAMSRGLDPEHHEIIVAGLAQLRVEPSDSTATFDHEYST